MKIVLHSVIRAFEQRPLLFITLVFIVSRLATYVLGVSFYTGFFEWGPQAVDIWLLKNKLWESIWYMHGQPPLFNLFLAAGFNIFPGNEITVFNIVFIAAGWLHSIVFLKLLIRLKLKQWLAVLLALYFVLSPAAVLYENFFYYTQFELLLLTLSCLLFVNFLEKRSLINGLSFFSCMAVLILTRSMFHWVWIVTVVVALFIALKHNRKTVLFAAIFPLLLSGGWFYKNYILYGKFASSTWLGMSLANITEPTDGIAVVKPWQTIDDYSAFVKPDKRYPGIEILHTPYRRDSMVNLNYLPYLHAYDQFLDASLKKIKKRPLDYAKNVARAHFLFFGAASNYSGLSSNRSAIRYYVSLYDFSFVNAVFRRITGEKLVGPAFYIGLTNIIVVALGILLAIKLFIKRLYTAAIILGFLLYNIIYVCVLGNLIEYGENVRFRFIIIPLVVAVAGIVIQQNATFFKKLKHFLKVQP